MTTLPSAMMADIASDLVSLYGPETGTRTQARLRRVLDDFVSRNPDLAGDASGDRLTEKDSILITYGDQVSEPGKAPLQTLNELLTQRLAGVVSGVHILPFFPYSSDDGFSVIDYLQVNPDFGDWDDVGRLGSSFRLMFDAVINHISQHSDWFKGFLRDDPAYTGFFITVAPGTDLSGVTRPRALPLLTAVDTPSGEKLVWTTFSADQIDLNFGDPELLLAVLEVLLAYIERGAELIRLDAIAYVWKEVGTTCIHLPQVHSLVQLMRSVLDAVAPHVLLVTETNVPHEENISYFGDGSDEAQMVYQFPLAPLLLNAFHTGDAGHLLRWADGLETPSESTTFFNFTASHDGVGVRPTEGILDATELQALAQRALDHGGLVSFKTNSDGSQSPYELNISYFDALSDPTKVDEEGIKVQVDRFIASQAIMLALAGVPGIYVHSLFGSRSWREGVEQTGRNRTINREKWDRATLEAALAEPASLRRQVFDRYTALLRIRTAHRAFHPTGSQRIIFGNPALFTVLRTSPDEEESLVCIHNVSDAVRIFRAEAGELGLPADGVLEDLLTGSPYRPAADGQLSVTVKPYQVSWLRL